MTGSFLRFVPALGVAVVVLVVAIGLAVGLRPTGFVILSVIIGLIMLGCLAVAAYLFSVCRRPLAGVGVVVVAAAVWSAFYLAPQAAPWLVWTILFFIGIGLIAFDTGKDTVKKAWWPVALLRVFIGWAWVDNAQDHFRVGNWFAGDGGQFTQVATGAAQRPAAVFVDSLYQAFLRAAVVPNPDAWAALTACGELTFGLMLAMGVLTPVAAWLSLWQSTHYMLMKGLLAHGAYTDKVFFIADLMLMLMGAGLVYGVDAALQHHAPAWVARWFLGVAEVEPPAAEATRVGSVSPQPT